MPTGPEPPGTAWGPLTTLPLPLGVADLLRSLQPQRGRRRSRRPPPGTLSEAYTPVGEDVVRDWLGFAPPTLSALRSEDVGEHFVLLGGGRSLPRRDQMGEGDNASVGVLYVPRALDWRTAPLSARRDYGLTSLDLLHGYGGPLARPGPADPAPLTRRSPASGDSTTVDLQGVRVGVQHREAGWTRLAWVLRSPDAFNATVWTTQEPLPAVEVLLRSRVLG